MRAKSTLIHITHEGWEQMGGIGTVLQGLITSAPLREQIDRNILVGPLPYADRVISDPIQRLGDHATRCLYSGPDRYDPVGLGAKLRPIELAFGTPIVYGTRSFDYPGAAHDTARRTSAELLLIDVGHPNLERLGELKFLLSDKFGIDSRRYEMNWDFEEWVRLADPAYHTLVALLPELPAQIGGQTQPAPLSAPPSAVVIGHEFMGVPTALRCALDPRRFRTAFHAHECSTARRIVEHLPGQDVAFYPAMRRAMAEGLFVGDVFGDQFDYSRHALVSSTHRLDAVLGVGDETAEELRFLSPAMHAGPVKTCFNAVPSAHITIAEQRRSRGLMNQWLQRITGDVPDYIFTHVTRPVPSKGLWRDLLTLVAMEPLLARTGKTATYILLTCGGPVRTRDQVDRMAREYGWPAKHHEGIPDLTGPEVDLWKTMQRAQRTMDERASAGLSGKRPGSAIKLILVNQFGWSQSRLGDACPAEMTFDDLRRAADLEFGLSIYEPFGISPLEPLHAGAVCAVSTISGCAGLVKRAMAELGLAESRLVVQADFTIAGSNRTAHDLVGMSVDERERLEKSVCDKLAATLIQRLPVDDSDRQAMLAEGQRLAERMSWDVVAQREFLAGLGLAAPSHGHSTTGLPQAHPPSIGGAASPPRSSPAVSLAAS